MNGLEPIIAATNGFGERLSAFEATAKDTRSELAKFESRIQEMQSKFSSANEETKKNIKDEIGKVLEHIQPKIAELERFSDTISAASERAGSRGNNAESDADHILIAAANHYEFTQAAKSGASGKYEKRDIRNAERDAYAEYKPLLMSAMMSKDSMDLANVRDRLTKNPVANCVFAEGSVKLQSSELESANLQARRFGFSAGMFSPELSAPEFQMPELFSELIKCFEDPTEITGLVNVRRTNRLRYRRMIMVPDTGYASWECDSQCTPNASDPMPLPETREGMVHAVSSTVCVHSDSLDDDDVDWASYIQRELGLRLKRTISRDILFGNGIGKPQGLVNNILKFDLANSPNPLPSGSFGDWVNFEIAGGMLKTGLKDVAIYGNSAGRVHLMTMRNAFSDRSNVYRIGANGEEYIGSYRYRTTQWLPETSDPQAVNNPLLPQKINYILGDMREAYTVVLRKEAGLSRHEPAKNGGNCVTFLARARLDGYVQCANAAIALVSP